MRGAGRTTSAIGVLTAFAILLIWAGAAGRGGLVFAAVFAPQTLAPAQ